MSIFSIFNKKINSENEGVEVVEKDIVMINIDGKMVEVTEDDSEVR